MRESPVLLDVTDLCCAHTDGALEYIFKAQGEDPPDNGIWEEHPNPFVRRIVELFTQRGLDRVAGLREELNRWLRGEMADPSPGLPPPRPASAMIRWTAEELGIARLYLSNLPADRFTLDDWLLLVDYLFQKYLPADDLRTEASWMASRANISGRLAAAMGEVEEPPDTVMAALPSVEEVEREMGMSAEQRAAIEFGRARCAEHVVGFSDAARQRLRNLIVDYQEASILGDRRGAAESLQGKLLDEFGTMNRDWRRIAVTEATENVNQGFVASQPPGTKLKRVEKYRAACPFCKSIHGRVVEVVSASAPNKDGDTQVWVGKTNVGRSASPKKRLDGGLVDREPHEMWWIAAGAMHPHCRGAWVKVGGASADPVFDAWLKGLGSRERAA